jgi:hypothetical protein
VSRDVATILGALERRRRATVAVSLRPELDEAYQTLKARLDGLGGSLAQSLAGATPEAQAILDEMEDLRKQIQDWEEPFILQSLDDLAWTNLRARMPVDPTQDVAGYVAWTQQVVAASLVEPALSDDELTRLHAALSAGAWGELFAAARDLTIQARSTVPFSLDAFVLSRSSDVKSKPPEPSVSPAPRSLADPPDSEPPSSGTSPAGSLAG